MQAAESAGVVGTESSSEEQRRSTGGGKHRRKRTEVSPTPSQLSPLSV